MTRAGAVAVLAGWAWLVVGPAAPVFADPTRLVTEPAGWRADPEQASALAQRFAATGHLGGLPSVTAAEAYVAPRPGVALFATRATATLSDEPTQAARAARVALDELRASAVRTSLSGGTAQDSAWKERVDPDARQVTATLTWNDITSHTLETARVVVASDGKRIVAVTGECLSGDAADPALVAACQAALATLDPGVAAASRVALALAPDVALAVPGEPPPSTGGTPSSPDPRNEPARLDDGSKFTLPPMTIPVDRPATDRRPVYVGAGVVLLALGLWWNRRQRARFEEEDRGDRPRPRRRPRNTDDDADDLRAAARGETPDSQDTPAQEAKQAEPNTDAKQDRPDP